MLHTLGVIYLLSGAACIAYYFVIGFYSRFGLSIQWIWLAAGAALIGLECLVVSGMSATAPPGMDYLVVLGASVYADGPSPALTRRLNAVTGCLDRHPDAVIIASGGQGAGEPVSEAQCIRDELVRRGVDPSRIRMEDRSTNTRENMLNSKALIGRDDAAVGIVTNNYHIWRSLRLARRAGFTNAHGIAAEYTGPTLFHYMVREAIAIAAGFLRGTL